MEKAGHNSLLETIRFYYSMCKLKTTKRSGWLLWNIKGETESIAEHVYGSIQLAWAIYSEFPIDVDIYKVVAMLSQHETEETKIGDITPFNGISRQEKLDMGNKAVDEIMSNIHRGNEYSALIKEFNDCVTVEAKFAHLCDKLDNDLQAKMYSDEGRCDINNISEKLTTNKKIETIFSNGATEMFDFFYEYDRPFYSETVFEEILDYVKGINVTK